MGFRKRVTINLLATWGDHVIGLAVGLILMPLVLGVLGDAQYGMWIFINSIAGYAGLLNLGLGQTISRYVSTYHAKGEREELNRVVNVIGAVYLLMGLVALGIAGVVAWLSPMLWPETSIPSTELMWVILILGINVAVSITGSVFGGVLVGMQRFDLERGITVTSGLVRFVLTLVFLQQSWGLLILALIFLVTTLVENVGLVIAAFRLVPEMRLGPRYLSRRTLQECFSFSVFALLEMVASKLIESTDCVVIGCIFGAEAIVPYYVAQRLCQFITKPLQFVGQVCLPRAGELHAKNQMPELRELVTRAMGLSWLLTMGFFIGAIFFGPVLIETWVHKSYPQSHVLLLVLLGGQLIATPMKVVSGVLFGIGDVRKPAKTYIIEAIFNFALSVALIFPFGLLGVAVGTAIPLYLIELGILLPYALKKLEMNPRRFFGDVIVPQTAPLFALLGYSIVVSSRVSLEPNWPHMLAVAGGGAIALGSTWIVHHQLVKWLNASKLGYRAVDIVSASGATSASRSGELN
jgi:O-antigen/teichoic acid export membrane protein